MKRNLIIATLVALFSFVTVAYFSCSKPGNKVSCTGSLCQNGGYCTIDSITHVPACVCPVGYEGVNCATASVDKFFGTWQMRQVIVGTDSPAYLNDTSYYPVYLTQTATPTTFFINNFFNNSYYNYIICTLDSTNSSSFIIDTISAYHMVYSHFIIQGGFGSINKDTIKALMTIQYKNKTSNWEIDTVSMTMYDQQ